MGMNAAVLVSTLNMEEQEWLEARKRGIGGSDAPKIVLKNYRWGSPITVWMDKTGQTDPQVAGESAYWGHQLEALVAAEFAKREGVKVRRRNAILQHPEYPWMLANIDREIVGCQEGLECKTASEYLKDEWKDDQLPDAYWIQCQHYLAVTGYQKWWIAVLIGGNKFVYKCVERDEEFIAALIQVEQKFWWHVENRVPPEMDGSEASSELLSKLYPNSNSQSIELAPDAIGLVEQYETAKAEFEAAESRKNEVENKLKQLLGEYEIGWAGERKVIWKTSVSNRFDSKTFKAVHPELHEQFLKPSPSRRFSIK